MLSIGCVCVVQGECGKISKRPGNINQFELAAKKTKKERKIDPNFEQTQFVFTAPLAKFEVPSLVVFFCLR